MLVNCTPHEVVVLRDNGSNLVVPVSGVVVRVQSTKTMVGLVDGVEVYKTSFGGVEGLPAPKDGVVYVVSTLCLTALGGTRNDCVAPGDAVRNDAGQVVGVRNFQVL